VIKLSKKNFTFKECREEFIKKYPEGGIVESHITGKYNVWFNKNGKIYSYSVGYPYQLAIKLNLFNEAEYQFRKHYKRLPCGCPVPKEENYYKCGNCGKIWREPTEEELQREKELLALWS